jgi:hypothetical protein
VLRPAKGAVTGLIPAAVIVLLSLRHELIHAALDNEDGHAKRFAEYATRLGFDAPFAYLTPSPGLIDEMMFLAIELGDFPHATLTVRDAVLTEAPTTGGGGTTTITSAGGSDSNRWLSFYCTEKTCAGAKSPVRMPGKKSTRVALICLEMHDGVPCMAPIRRK